MSSNLHGAEELAGVDAGHWPFQPPLYSCAKHGSHRDWMQFRWSARAGVSNLYCLRCFADHLDTALPAGGVVVLPVTPTP